MSKGTLYYNVVQHIKNFEKDEIISTKKRIEALKNENIIDDFLKMLKNQIENKSDKTSSINSDIKNLEEKIILFRNSLFTPKENTSTKLIIDYSKIPIEHQKELSQSFNDMLSFELAKGKENIIYKPFFPFNEYKWIKTLEEAGNSEVMINNIRGGKYRKKKSNKSKKINKSKSKRKTKVGNKSKKSKRYTKK